MTKKDFGAIESDYAFFMAHATEAEQDAAHYASVLRDFASHHRERIRMLDFGCGTGNFTYRLLSLLAWDPDLLELVLCEPVTHQLAGAIPRLEGFTRGAVIPASDLQAVQNHRYDVILSNHVLYYVDNLAETLRSLLQSLNHDGLCLLAISGWDNHLLQFWRTGFAYLGRPVPYNSAEDVEDTLARLGATFQKKACDYQLRFVDTEQNRLKILRFLFGDFLSTALSAKLMKEFDAVRSAGHVHINTLSHHFVVSPLSTHDEGGPN